LTCYETRTNQRCYMDRWSDWIDIELAKSQHGLLSDFGVYQIRVVTPSGEPISISRMVGVDSLGILYVGRSGYRHQRSKRTVANRIREFLRQQHSGGVTYARAKDTLQRASQFSDHRLQVRAMFLPDEEIDAKESGILRDYFSRHGELPPCNSQLPTAR
jgi:hypothetical protein